MGSNLNTDEFETIFELILSVIFMMFGVFSIASMTRIMVKNTELSKTPDKIEITTTTHYAEDPFWFTGYQAYMFAWHMDELSQESLSYVGGNEVVTPPNTPTARLDGIDKNHVTLSVLQDDGTIMPQFLVWRNQMITGTGQGATRSVKNTLASITAGTSYSLSDLYRGNIVRDSKNLMFHLELTGEFSNTKDLGDSVNYGGKTFQWVLTPRYH